MAAADVRRGRRAGRHHAHAPQRAGVGADRPRLSLRRPARDRQDDDRAAARAGAAVSGAQGQRRAVRRVPGVRGRSGHRRRHRDRRAPPTAGSRTSARCARTSSTRRRAAATRSTSSTRCTSSPSDAFDALLKTLEEPPPHVVFVLATTDPRDMPATILSRVQRFDFRPIAPDAAVGDARAHPQRGEDRVRGRRAAGDRARAPRARCATRCRCSTPRSPTATAGWTPRPPPPCWAPRRRPRCVPSRARWSVTSRRPRWRRSTAPRATARISAPSRATSSSCCAARSC